MLIDTHCHLNFNSFDKDLSNVVRRSIKSGVERILVPGTDLASSKKAIEIAKQFPSCFAAIGIHPHHSKDSELIIDKKLESQLSNLIQNKKVVAIGEIGLDYYHYKKTKYIDTEITKSYKEKQNDLFLLQLNLAKQNKLPVIFHCRKAFPDTLELLKKRMNNSQIRGVFHCFSGSKKVLRQVLDMGFYIGFDGNITYSHSLYSIVQNTPLDRILLETDSPFLTPVPFRNKRNEPKNIPLIAQKIAAIQNIPINEVVKQTTHNAKTLFGLL